MLKTPDFYKRLHYRRFWLSKKLFRQPANESQLKQTFIRSIIFLFGFASRPENDIGSSIPTAPRGVHAAAAD